jgi:hypothetical protein
MPIIPDTLLKVLLNTNKTGAYVLCYSWHIVKSGIKPVLLVFNATFQQCVRYNVEHGDQFKAGHHVLSDTWHIVESVVKHQ